MKRFILQIIGFSFLTISLTVGLILYSNKKMNDGSFFTVNEKTKFLIIGDSHPECAFNDSLIEHTSNFAYSGESYFYQYLKTKKLLEKNKEIKTVFIEFNNGQIEKGMDDNIWGAEQIAWRYPKYSAYMDFIDLKILLSKNWKATFDAQAISLKNNLRFLLKRNKTLILYGGWGAYLPLDNEGTEILNQSMNDEMVELDSLIDISEVNIEYLLKTIRYCKDNKVTVYLIRSPVHPKYRGLLNEKTFQMVLKSKLSGMEFLDFKSFPAMNSEFADYHHLNRKGARKFSIFFNDLIEAGLLEDLNKKLLIDKAFEKLEMLSVD